jgi:alpha,alpha-trehalase
MVDNFIYEIEHYGKILNGNRTYHLNRSQPPFFAALISAAYAKMEKNEQNKAWLEKAIRAAIKEYEQVWMGPDRLTAIGLSRYFGNGREIPPEVEKGHFNFILAPVARRLKLSVEELVHRYNSGALKEPALDEFFANDRAVRESGHDTTYRWRVGGADRAADFATVDLNSLLYRCELELSRLIAREFGGELPASRGRPASTSGEWRGRALSRKALMLKYLWDPERKIFFDYDFKRERRSAYLAATSFFPFWAQDPADRSTWLLDEGETRASLAALASALEAPGGIAATSRESLERAGDPRLSRQWEYPNGWAPHQMIAWQALKNAGMGSLADRLIYKWLFTIARNAADYNGTVPEKFDVVSRSHAVFSEYGNVGTRFSYITQEGFGWMNASFQVGLRQLSPQWLAPLQRLQPPEWLDFSPRPAPAL